MKIYIIRHGLTELNKQGRINGFLDDALAPEGVEQAKRASEFLPNTVKHIYCSSLERTRQTAEILNMKLQVPITFHDELKEVNFGVLNGQPFLPEYKHKHKNQIYDWRPSGESFNDVRARVIKILKEIRSSIKDGEALIVAHGGIIRMLHFIEFGTVFDEIENASLHSFDLDKILINA